MQPSSKNLIWIDLEMTGLHPAHDKIIEIGTIITNSSKHLDIIAEGPMLAIHQPEEVLANMDNWNTKHHTASGLLQRVRESQVTLEAAEEMTLDFIMLHVPPQKSPICGNGVCQDRRFLFQHMPTLERYFRYRNLDVSVLKELACLWRPALLEGFEKEYRHLVRDDIHESIKEMRYYIKYFLKCEE